MGLLSRKEVKHCLDDALTILQTYKKMSGAKKYNLKIDEALGLTVFSSEYIEEILAQLCEGTPLQDVKGMYRYPDRIKRQTAKIYTALHIYKPLSRKSMDNEQDLKKMLNRF